MSLVYTAMLVGEKPEEIRASDYANYAARFRYALEREAQKRGASLQEPIVIKKLWLDYIDENGERVRGTALSAEAELI